MHERIEGNGKLASFPTPGASLEVSYQFDLITDIVQSPDSLPWPVGATARAGFAA
jgi:hypothetical protein